MVKSSLILGAIAALGTYVQAKEIKVDEKKAARLYDTGVMHNKLKASKEVCFPSYELSYSFTNILRLFGRSRKLLVLSPVSSTPHSATLSASKALQRPSRVIH